MLCGQPPFCADDPMDIYQKILRNKVSYPASFSKNVRDIVSKLLVSNPAARLGSLKNKVQPRPLNPDSGPYQNLTLTQTLARTSSEPEPRIHEGAREPRRPCARTQRPCRPPETVERGRSPSDGTAERGRSPSDGTAERGRSPSDGTG